VQTEGVNFNAIWELSPAIVLHNEIRSNDIYELLLTYGVEAARQSIVDEIKGVFGVYGIDVNPRHLSLIADFMTRTGSYIPMNRSGMLNCPSPFVQMSFETTCSFLTKAAQDGLTDTLDSPTGQIVVGNAPKLGTGCFNLMVPMNA
jgi:DNA-directed RNA polymerase I subunit RPA1